MNNKTLIVNAKSLLSPLTGIGRYTYEVVSRLPVDGQLEYLYDYYGKVSREIRTSFENEVSNPNAGVSFFSIMRKIITSNNFTKSMARSIIEMSDMFSRSRYDLYWEPSIIPEKRLLAEKNIVTVHDMSLHLHKEWHKQENISYFEKNFWKYIDRADVIITDTEAVRSEVTELTRIPAERITAIHLGADHNVFKVYPEEELRGFRQKLKVDRKLIVFIGSIEPRKNLERLIRAYTSLPKEVKDEYYLMLAGYKGWKNDTIHSLIEKESGNIGYLGSVSDRELAYLYNVADFMVYPSLYEGFGLPPIEAMACGLPVITSSIPCLNEVCADASLRVDPLDEGSIAEGILNLTKSETLKRELSEKGLAHASAFNWAKTSKHHHQVFTKLL